MENKMDAIFCNIANLYKDSFEQFTTILLGSKEISGNEDLSNFLLNTDQGVQFCRDTLSYMADAFLLKHGKTWAREEVGARILMDFDRVDTAQKTESLLRHSKMSDVLEREFTIRFFGVRRNSGKVIVTFRH